MNKGDWNRAHMYANLLYHIRTDTVYNSLNVERVKALEDWFKRTGREDIIAEAERLCNERMQTIKQ